MMSREVAICCGVDPQKAGHPPGVGAERTIEENRVAELADRLGIVALCAWYIAGNVGKYSFRRVGSTAFLG